MRRALIRHRSAFTLVELLMVITIIAILIGLLVPTVFYAFTTIKKRAIGIELQTLANAIDQYNNKYGDYPPDGSSIVDFQRHYRNLFKTMAESEFTAVGGAADANNGAGAAGYMDPPEALVFALGGFSADPIHPFTGPGGPIIVIPGTPITYQYNVDRNSPLYEFKEAQLTIDTSGGTAMSIDETLYSLVGANDAMPVYKAPYGKIAPFVYFRASTYTSGPAPFWNNYGSATIGYCRPYRSDKLNTSVAPTPMNANIYYRYMNDKTYQLISAGLDDNFGGIPYTSGGGPIFFRYPSGDEVNFAGYPSSAPTAGTTTRYNDGDASHPQFDNVANFADGTLEDGLSN